MSRGSHRQPPPSRRRLRAARARRARQRQLVALLLGIILLATLIFLLVRGCDSAAESGLVQGNAEAAVQADDPAAPSAPGEDDPPAAAAPPAPPAPAKPTFESLAFPAPRNPASVVKVPILMFHHVGETPPDADAIRTGLTVSAADFDGMMAYLKQAGYNPITHRQLFQSLYFDVPLPPQPVMLTFDDGYLDNYQVAVPTLEKYGFTGTFFIITEMVGTPEYMSWEQVAEVEKRGMELGAHTSSHADLTTLDAAGLKHELFDSSATMTAQLGHPVYWLCYPAGKYDEGVMNFCRDSGYLLAVTTEPGELHSSDAPFALPRYRVRHDSGVAGLQELVR